MLTYIHIFPSSVLKGPRNNDSPVAMNTPSAQILFSKYHSQIKGTRCCLDKWLMSGLGQEKYVSLEHLVVLESKEVLPKKKKKMGEMLKEQRSQLERVPNGQI